MSYPARPERAGPRVRGPRGWKSLQLGFAVVDSALWMLSLALATWGRHDFVWRRVRVGGLVAAAGIAIAVHLACGFVSRLYLGRRRPGSVEEATTLASCTAVTTMVVVGVVALGRDPHLVPLSAALAAGAYQLIAALAIRYTVRLGTRPRLRRPLDRPHRALVFGAGDAGSAIAKALLVDKRSELLPVAFLDDDPAKAFLELHGLSVAGGRSDVAAAASEYRADTLLIAMPSAPPQAQAAVADLGRDAGLAVKLLPSAGQRVFDGSSLAEGIRTYTVADYLRRDEVRMDIEQVAAFVTGRRVLVTGAGGFIGGALCDALARFGPKRLTLMDHDESGLTDVLLRLSTSGIAGRFEVLLASVRDRDAVWQHFASATPDVVFHVAAHKHVDILERFPVEAWKTNVAGTLNVLQAAAAAGTERFVNVSSDKAANPIGALGASKRISEMLTAHFAAELGRAYMSVRFGNVLDSTGSVMHTFRHQARHRKPLTVTHPEVSRYFMTVEEAVRLVVQAAAIGQGGDALVLDMGEPVPIVELARQLAAEVRPMWEPEIVFIGLRPGDKLTEDLVSSQDTLLDQPHERVSRYRVPPLDPAQLVGLVEAGHEMLGRRMLHIANGPLFDTTDFPR